MEVWKSALDRKTGRVRALLLSFAAISIVWSLGHSLKDPLERGAWFRLTGDEALHAEIVERFSQTGRYGQWAEGVPFSANLTTGPTVILPAAVLSSFFGIPGAVAGRVVVFFYFLGLLCVVFLGIQKRFKSNAPELSKTVRTALSVAALGVFVIFWRSHRETHYFTFGILGEGAGAFFLVLAVFFSERNKWFWVGLASILCCLSKPYFLIFPASTGLFLLLWRRDVFFSFLKGATLIIGIFMIPLFFRLGFFGTFEFLKSYPSIMRASNGGGIHLGEGSLVMGWLKNGLEKIKHFNLILSPRGTLGLGCGFWACFLILKSQHKNWFLPFLFYGGISLFWWVFLSPGVQARYFLPTYLVFVMAGLLGFEHLLLFRAKKILIGLNEKWLRNSLFFGWLVLIGNVGMSVGQTWTTQFKSLASCGFCRQLEAQRIWREIHSEGFIFSTSRLPYAKDLGMFLNAPYFAPDLDFDTFNGLLDGSWFVTVGEDPDPARLKWLKENPFCRPYRLLMGGDDIGFWRCRRSKEFFERTEVGPSCRF